ncbi:UBP-type zinc finger domain-containing protein [Nocardiopsis flavescens]|uniref:Ubiquitin-hydrolase Zn-finger-containing protein n=1 Tax=Nocardiopsis flavescens TaxID=758803 RepID=A0A1M6MGL4_9ACTN|nr:UBP-type zinc finger domain-containing protein [Nocardiopsis flavescens]SHJ82594.1 ubiquitin-hydrolase Zn-finger-containing protein [Nocardiopsis flavescens]
MSDSQNEIDPSAPPTGPGCRECDEGGGWWFHLRRCAACGHVGCCDSSPGRHATGHFEETGHPFIQSYEPGEVWFYDFRSGGTGEGPALAEPTSHPADQPSPGPADRVPGDWTRRLNR